MNPGNWVLMAGNEVENCNNARDPADKDDGNSGNSCLPLILVVQWLLNDHVDALIKIEIFRFNTKKLQSPVGGQ